MPLPQFVLDCSVTLSWCFVDEQDEFAVAVLNSLVAHTAVVPAIWPLEVANGLLMAERRKRSTEADTAKWLATLAALPIEIDQRLPGETFAAVVPLARPHGLTSYDSSYLEIAVRRSLPVATMDERLRTAALSIGVKLFHPATHPRRKK